MTMMFQQLLLAILLVFFPIGSLGFAAKKGGGKKNVASTNKGFAPPPLNYEQVLSQFRTRVPEDADSQQCPCGTGKMYKECCAPFHRGEPCKTMTDVLRSRYTAFTWRLIGHVIETTDKTSRDYTEDKISWAKNMNRKGGMFDSYDFVLFEPGKEEPGEDQNSGYIEFKIIVRAKADVGSTLEGREMAIVEKSKFLRDSDGKWAYASGDVRSDVPGLEDTTLNS
jgi:SEC-C motif-containing protein